MNFQQAKDSVRAIKELQIEADDYEKQVTECRGGVMIEKDKLEKETGMSYEEFIKLLERLGELN